MIDVMIITYNEALNLPHCLQSLQGWTRQVFVIDSGSTDGTQEIARAHGAELVEHRWEGYARQKNWGLRNLPFEADWILIIDADEVITDDLREALVEIAARPVDEVRENGFFLNRVTYFLDRPIRHCGYFPAWNLRFFKRGQAVYEDRIVHEHMVIDDPVGRVPYPMIHDDRRGLEHYVGKHNRYSTLEAKAIYSEITGQRKREAEAKILRETSWRRWLKRNVLPRAPMPWMWRFLYMYVVRLGFLDGRAGFEFCKFISMYDYLVAMKLHALRRKAKGTQVSIDEPQPVLEGAGAQSGAMPRALAPEVPEATPAKPSPPVIIQAPVQAPPAPTSADPEPWVEEARLTDEQRRETAAAKTKGVSILILTLNEEKNMPACLEAIAWADDVVVFDSYSTDGTTQVAKQYGARVVRRKFDNWAAHQNWAMENIEFRHDWVFYLDADERMTDALRDEILAVANDPDEERVAFYCGRKNYFMGKWIKRSMPPGMIMRFFRPPQIRFERLVNPTPVIEGRHGYLEGMFLHYNFSKGLTEWFDKHNKYSKFEAMEGMKLLRGEIGDQPSIFSRDRALRRKALKNLSFRMPFRSCLKFMYLYFFRLGLLDGRAGFTYCLLQAIYEYMIVVKMKELRRRERGQPI